MTGSAVPRFTDPSLALAVSALVRGHPEGGGDGPMRVGALAGLFHEDYLAVHRDVPGLAHIGTLSIDDTKPHLYDVLHRLHADGVITGADPPFTDESTIMLAPSVVSAASENPQAFCASMREQARELMNTPEPAPVARASVEGGSVLTASGLTKTYKRRKVVDDVHLSLRQGEIVGLLGPNGAGKTTTFYMIVGLVRPECGEIFFDDENIRRLPMYRRARRGIGYLAQEPSIFRKLTVEDNVLAILETLGLSRTERRERLETLLDELGIKQLRNIRAYQLSGGERRRLEITRALVTQPKFMLLDEPFAGVDPIAVHDIQTIVANLRQRGIGVLITDHNVEQTLDIVDRAYIMFEGKVQVSGTVEELVMNDEVADLYLGPTLTTRLRARLGATA